MHTKYNIPMTQVPANEWNK